MVSQRERIMLMEVFRRERITGAAILPKCVVGLLIIAGLAVIGTGTNTSDTFVTATNQPRWQQHENASVADSKSLDQERQARVEPAQSKVGNEISTVNAVDVINPSQKSNLTQRGVAPVKPVHN